MRWDESHVLACLQSLLLSPAYFLFSKELHKCCKVKVNFQPVNTGRGAHLPLEANWARLIFRCVGIAPPPPQRACYLPSIASTHLYTWVERSNYVFGFFFFLFFLFLFLFFFFVFFFVFLFFLFCFCFCFVFCFFVVVFFNLIVFLKIFVYHQRYCLVHKYQKNISRVRIKSSFPKPKQTHMYIGNFVCSWQRTWETDGVVSLWRHIRQNGKNRKKNYKFVFDQKNITTFDFPRVCSKSSYS